MRKYAFRQGDIVREKTDEKKPVVGRPVIGRVIGCGSSAGHDYYKVESGCDIYNARDDELVLVRRGPAPRSYTPIDENELERFLLIWRPMSVDPPKGELCAVLWKEPRGEERMDLLRWDGEEWVDEYEGQEWIFGRDNFTAWALWEWPEIDEEEGERDDADPDNGQAGD